MLDAGVPIATALKNLSQSATISGGTGMTVGGAVEVLGVGSTTVGAVLGPALVGLFPAVGKLLGLPTVALGAAGSVTGILLFGFAAPTPSTQPLIQLCMSAALVGWGRHPGLPQWQRIDDWTAKHIARALDPGEGPLREFAQTGAIPPGVEADLAAAAEVAEDIGPDPELPRIAALEEYFAGRLIRTEMPYWNDPSME